MMHCSGETGADAAGEVIDVGPGVSSFKAGDKVVAMLNFMVSDGLLKCFFPLSSRGGEK